MAHSIALLKFILLLLTFWSWYRVRARLGPTSLALGLQLALAAIVEGVCGWLMSRNIPNLFIYNVAVPLEFLLLMIYARAFVGPSRLKDVQLVLSSVVFGLALIEILVRVFCPGFVGVTYMSGALVISMVFTYVLFKLASNPLERIASAPAFWIALGTAVFYCGSMPVVGLINALNMGDHHSASELYTINDVLFGIRYVLLIHAFRLAFVLRRSATGER